MEKIKNLVSIIFVFMFFVSGSVFAEDKIQVLLSKGQLQNVSVVRANDIGMNITINDDLSSLSDITIKEILQKLLVEKKTFYIYKRLNILESLFPFKAIQENSYKIFFDQEKNLLYEEKILNEPIAAFDIWKYYIVLLLSLFILVMPMIPKILFYFYSENKENLGKFLFFMFLIALVVQLILVSEFKIIVLIFQLILIIMSLVINILILEKISAIKSLAIFLSSFLMVISVAGGLEAAANVRFSQYIIHSSILFFFYFFIAQILFFIVYFLEKRKTQTLEYDFQFDRK